MALWTGTTCTHFFVLYGHPNSSTDREQQAKNDILLREAFEWAAELGNVPIVVCGDFNTSVVASPTLTNTVGTQNYWDLAQLECLQKLEVEPMPTCYQQYKSKGSRIDHIFANTFFASSLISFGCVQGSYRCDAISTPSPRTRKDTAFASRENYHSVGVWLTKKLKPRRQTGWLRLLCRLRIKCGTCA